MKELELQKKYFTKQLDTVKILVDSITKLNDKIYKYQMNLIKPDTESSYWYVYYESHSMVRGYEILKMKTKCFSLDETQKVLHEGLKVKPTEYIGVEFFYPVSEYTYNEWKSSKFNK
jgi:hypothetical protein